MEDLINRARALEPYEQHRLAERIAANVGYDLIAEGHEDLFRKVHLGLAWALDLIESYDERLIEMGEPADKVRSAIHEAAKRKAFRDLTEFGAVLALSRAALEQGGQS